MTVRYFIKGISEKYIFDGKTDFTLVDVRSDKNNKWFLSYGGNVKYKSLDEFLNDFGKDFEDVLDSSIDLSRTIQCHHSPEHIHFTIFFIPRRKEEGKHDNQ